jgi:hypothetical protein
VAQPVSESSEEQKEDADCDENDKENPSKPDPANSKEY